MDDDIQFTQELVREFMISKNFKVSNRELVSRFKPFLTNSEKRDVNRGKFRDYVNTLATVKQDEKGEKILVLKKKYRKGSPPSPAAENLSTDKKQDRNDKQPSPDASTTQQTTSEHVTSHPVESSHGEAAASAADDSISSSGSSMALAETPGPEAETVTSGASGSLRTPSVKVTKPSVTEDDVDGPGASRPAPPQEVASPLETKAQDEVFNTSDAPSNGDGDMGEDEDFKPVPLPNSMSVKERAKHLNKIESDSNLQNTSVKMRKHESVSSDGGDKRDDDSSSVSSSGYTPMDQMDRDWMITVSTADYHPMHRLLTQKPELAKRRSALHWAAKHGKAEVIKLLCGVPGINVNARSGYTPLHMAAMHGFEDIIELLVHGYNADSNLRDYSGKKPKQYLRNSASSRTHQILQARRPSSVIVNGNQPFKRVGSYSAKIQKSGFFGIHGASALRSSWATGSDAGSDKDRASPSPSLSPTPSPRSSPLPSPRSRRKGSKPQRPPPPKLPPRPPPRRRKGAPGAPKCGPSPLVLAITERLDNQATTESNDDKSAKQQAEGEVKPSVEPEPASTSSKTQATVAEVQNARSVPQTNQGTLDLSDIREEDSFGKGENDDSIRSDHGSSDLAESEQRKDDSEEIQEEYIQNEEAALVYLPHQGESSDYVEEETPADEAQIQDATPKKVTVSEITDDEQFSGIYLMDRLLGGSSTTDPEPLEKNNVKKDDEKSMDKDILIDEDNDDEWANNLRSQSAFLLSSGFFTPKEKEELEESRQSKSPQNEYTEPEDQRHQSAFLQSARLFGGFEEEEERQDYETDSVQRYSEDQTDDGEQMFENAFLQSANFIGQTINEGDKDDDRYHSPPHQDDDPSDPDSLRYQSAFLQSAGLFGGYDKDEADCTDTQGSEPYQEDVSEAERLRSQSAALQSVGYFSSPRRDHALQGHSHRPQYYDDEPVEADDFRHQSAFLQSAGYFGQPQTEEIRDDSYGAAAYHEHHYRDVPSDYSGRYWSGSGGGSRYEPSGSPYDMAPYTQYYEDEPPVVPPPRRRRGRQHPQSDCEGDLASPLPTAPPRRRRHQKEATPEATRELVESVASLYHHKFSNPREQDLMPPPHAAPSRKKRSRKDQDKENVERLPRPHSVPVNLTRSGSNPEVSAQNTMTTAPVTSPFI